LINNIKFIKNIKKFLSALSSPKIACFVIFIITLIILTVLLSSRYYLFQNVIEEGISKKDVIATKTIQIIDVEKTEKRKHDVAEKVEPILSLPQESISNEITKNLEELLGAAKQVRVSKESLGIKKAKMKTLLGIKDENYLTSACINYLSKSSNSNFSKISSETHNSLSRILDAGLSEKDWLNSIGEIIRRNTDYSLSGVQRETVSILIKKIIYPNTDIDEQTTDLARKNAINSIKPVYVTFKNGDKIILKGELVNRLQKDALRKLGYNVSQIDLRGIFGIFLLVGVCLFTIAYYLINFDSKYLTASYLSLISLLAISTVACTVFLPADIPVYLVPIPAVAILLTIFTNPRISLIATLMIIVMTGVSLQYRTEAMTVFILSTMIATFISSKINYYRRMDMVRAGFDIGLIQTIIILSVYILQSSIGEVEIRIITSDVSSGFISGIISGIVALGTLPLIENMFNIITPYGLTELTDHNQALLKRLQFEAPGTYHHSLMVSNLAEAAAEAIGANPVLVRVGAFYHDIGKLKRPMFFVENQSYFGIENPHEKLNPRLSKMVITAHPKDGLELAKEYNLPNIVNQLILQHHGDGLALYFYKQAMEKEGAENVTEEQFRYTCPKPSTKEAGILMLSDAVESATKAIKSPTSEEIEEIVDRMIRERLLDSQLSETPLTQKDLKIIAMTFKRILRGMQHHRIKYHENILEELNEKTSMNLQLMAQTARKFEKELIKGLEEKGNK